MSRLVSKQNANEIGPTGPSQTISVSSANTSDELVSIMQKTLLFLEEMPKKITKQEQNAEKMQNLVYFGFFVILLMVAAMIIAYVNFQIVNSNDQSQRITTVIEKMDEKIDDRDEKIELLNTQIKLLNSEKDSLQQKSSVENPN